MTRRQTGTEPPAPPPRTEAQVAQALERLPDGVLVTDEAGVLGAVNAEAARLAGVEAAVHLGLPLSALFDASPLDWADIGDAIAAGRGGEFAIRGASGRTLLATVRVLGAGAMVVLRDLEVLDHHRRAAVAQAKGAGFAVLSDRKARPDFSAQRLISPFLDRVLARGERALLQGMRILLSGESGTGKTEIARYLHGFIADGTDPFVVVNCASIPETLFESEFFGYEKGAFTGALAFGKKGLVEEAAGGTLFLDEVGEIPPLMQAKLLSFLEDGMIQRVGGARPRPVQVRVMAATNRDLAEMVAARAFRRDLYHRLAVLELKLRPLREMPELLDHLVDRFAAILNQRRSRPLTVTPALRQRFRAHAWPGNIRELFNLMQQVSVLADEGEEGLAEIDLLLAAGRPAEGAPTPEGALAEGRPLRDIVRDWERRVIDAAIREEGSKRRAAERLGVDIGTIVRKTKNQQGEDQ